MSVRLLGVAATGLTEQQQLTLFEAGDQRRQRATEATDEVRKRFGSRAIRRARLLDAGVRSRSSATRADCHSWIPSDGPRSDTLAVTGA